ncbi:MAG: paraquat-inducible protein A [Syntrophobacteraceae bacterium]
MGEIKSAMALIACHECDLLQRERDVPPGGKALCARCGALLYRNVPRSIDRSLALTFAAGVTFVIANVFPFVTISAAGRFVQTTIFGSILEMWKQGMALVAPMVFLNAIAIPGLSILATGYVLMRSRLGGPPGHLIDVLRLLQVFKPWGMVEVFLLGLLVSVVKLGSYARVIPDVALWAIGVLVLLTATLSTVFEPREIWARIDAARLLNAPAQTDRAERGEGRP